MERYMHWYWSSAEGRYGVGLGQGAVAQTKKLLGWSHNAVGPTNNFHVYLIFLERKINIFASSCDTLFLFKN